MAKFYFTYGSESQPYVGGWTEVDALDIHAACGAFRAFHPDKIEGLLNCCSVYPEDIRVLRREDGEPTEAMQNGKDFEREVYMEAAGYPRKPHPRWESGIKAVARVIQRAPVQIKCSRPLEVDGESFLVYGILDALKAGIIYDVKFRNKRFSNAERDPGVYGKYLNSAQHPFYFYIVPGAYEFQYLLSDGEDLYVETYRREEVRSAESIISEFMRSIREMGLLALYREKWQAK